MDENFSSQTVQDDYQRFKIISIITVIIVNEIKAEIKKQSKSGNF